MFVYHTHPVLQQGFSSIYHAPVFYFTLPEGGSLAYLDSGSKKANQPTIIFLHGLATYAGSWQQNIATLKNHARCICIDLPGFGLSDTLSKGYTLKYIAALLATFIKEKGLAKVTVAGHSMGGQIAIHLALQAPYLVQKLVLISPAGFEQFSIWDKQIILNGTNMLQWFSSPENYLKQMLEGSFFSNAQQGKQMIRELVALMKRYSPQEYNHIVRSYINAMLQEPVWGRLQDIAPSVLTLFGESDALIPNKMIHSGTTRQLAIDGCKKIPRCRLHIIKQAGHYVHWEKANEVNTHITEFLH